MPPAGLKPTDGSALLGSGVVVAGVVVAAGNLATGVVGEDGPDVVKYGAADRDDSLPCRVGDDAAVPLAEEGVPATDDDAGSPPGRRA